MPYFVYIMTNKDHGTLYIGVTNDLVRRAYEHRTGATAGFSRKYNLTRLVYYEDYPSAAEAIAREKSMKEWKRAWKIDLIEGMNPAWDDLYERLAS